MKQHIKTFAVIILITLVVSTLCDMLNAVDCFLPTLSGVTIAALIKPLVLFGLTTYFIKRYKATVKPSQIICATLIGAIAVELVLHIIHFLDTLISLPDMLISVLVILAAWYYALSSSKLAKTIVGVAVLALVIYLAFWGYAAWGRFAISFY